MAAHRQCPSQHGASMLSALLTLLLLLSSLLPVANAAPRTAEANTPIGAANNSITLLTPPRQPAATWTVCASGCDFELIEAAIDDGSVANGDTLLVMDAVHTEDFIWVDKDVIIRGQGVQNTIVQAANRPPDPSSSNARLLTVESGTIATVADMTLRYGSSFGRQDGTAVAVAERDDGDAEAIAFAEGEMDFRGAGITVLGNLTLDRSIVSDNYIFITSTMQALASATAPITATAQAYALALNDLYASGAGIHNTGNLTVTNSTIADNEIYAEGIARAWAEASGGVITETAVVTSVAKIAGAAIYNGGAMWLTNSTVSGNRAHTSHTAHAGNELPPWPLTVSPAPSHFAEENVSVYRVTGSESAYVRAQWGPDGRRILSGNHGTGSDVDYLPGWSGRLTNAPRLTQDESVSSAQIESQAVAGIYNAGEATIHFSTISNNSATTDAEATGDETSVSTDQVGGLFNEMGASLTVDNTILAAQADGPNCGQTAGSSNGYNLDDDGSCALSGPDDQSNVDAQLGPLDDNGGPTPTHTLLYDSPAVDAADPNCPTALSATDQRGVARPVDGDGDGAAVCDIGAVEAQFDTDLSVAKSGPAQAVTAGETATFTITVTNNGPRDAWLVTVTDTLPASLTYVGSGSNATCGVPDNQNRLTCSLPDIPANDSHAFQIQGRVAPDAAAAGADGTVTITNTAQVEAFGPDPVAANDEVQAAAPVEEGFADLKISKFGPAGATLQAGEPFTYTLVVDNLGPAAARGVQISDNILASDAFTLTRAVEDPDRPDSCDVTLSGDTLQCHLHEPLEPQGTPGSSARWVIQVVVTAQEGQEAQNLVQTSTGPGTYTAEGIEWTSGTPDPQPDNNETSVFISVEAAADLQLSGEMVGQVQVDGQPGNTFTLTPGQVTAGASLTYTLTLHNAGPSTAGNVRLDHYMPSSLQSMVIDPQQGSCDSDLPADPATPLTCQLGTLAVGQTVTVVLRGPLSSALPEGTSLNSHALVSSDAFDPHNQNNNAVLNGSANSRADLSIGITQQQQPVVVGQPLTYTVFVQNAGPSGATTATVSNVLPTGVADAVWHCEATGGASCRGTGAGNIDDRVSLPAGSALTYTVEARVASCTPQENVATVSDIDDPYPQDNSARTVNTMHCTHLPLLSHTVRVAAPDLVVQQITASENDVEVVIENVGDAPAGAPFWVDLYVAPEQPPRGVNQLWRHLADQGIAWGVTAVSLAPGEQLALRYGDDYYAEPYSDITWPLPPGTPLYAQVDSFNTATDYGAVLENHEIEGSPYNNISGPVTPEE